MTLGNRDPDPRIRHLPPGDGEGSRQAPRPRRLSRSPRLAAFLGGAAVFTLILVVFGLGGRQPEDTSTTTIPELAGDEPVDFTTTTLVRPVTLADRLGSEVESVRLATVTDDGSRVMLWHADSLTPRHYPITSASPVPRFDVSGKFIAYLDHGAIYVQQTGHRLEVPLVDKGRGFAWHPTDEGRFAFAITGASGTDVVVGRAGPVVAEVAIVASVPGAADLVSWGDWGYALSFDEASRLGGGVPGILVIDDMGVPLRAVAGVARVAAGGTILIQGPGADTAPVWDAALLAASPAPTIVPAPVGLDLFDEHLEAHGVLAAESGDALGVLIDDSGYRVAVWDTTSGLTVNIVDFTVNVPRVIAFQEQVLPVSFVRGGQAIALQSALTEELLIVDTGTGATVRLPVDPGTTILDAWL